MLFNNNSPIPHPSYTQHVTPKASNANSAGKKIASSSTGSGQINNSRFISKVNNNNSNNCMIGIGKGLPPGE